MAGPKPDMPPPEPPRRVLERPPLGRPRLYEDVQRRLPSMPDKPWSDDGK